MSRSMDLSVQQSVYFIIVDIFTNTFSFVITMSKRPTCFSPLCSGYQLALALQDYVNAPSNNLYLSQLASEGDELPAL